MTFIEGNVCERAWVECWILLWCDRVLKSGTVVTHASSFNNTITSMIISLPLRDVDTNKFSATNRAIRVCFPRCLSHHYNKLTRQRHSPAAYFVRHTQIDTNTINEHPRLPWRHFTVLHCIFVCLSCVQVKRICSAKRVWETVSARL